MKGIVAFLPADPAFFDEIVGSLYAGRKINPEAFLVTAFRIRRNAWRSRRWPRALATILETAKPAEPSPGSTLWVKVRTHLEKLDFKLDATALRVKKVFEPELHFEGRPFFVGEGSAERVAEAVAAMAAAESEGAADRLAQEQLARLDPELPNAVEPMDGSDLDGDLSYRAELLSEMKKVHDLSRAARESISGTSGRAGPATAEDALIDELPWRAAWLMSRVAPFWVARDVDGLETVCRAAGVPPPDCLVPAWRLFAEACESFPRLKAALHLELRKPKDVGAYAAPADVPEILDFLQASGAKIIGAATRAGEGPRATTLLRKIKECAVYAQRTGAGYLEASGLVPPDLPQDA